MSNPNVSAAELVSLTETYINQCIENHRLPNLAGLCRFAGISSRDFQRLASSAPQQITRIRDALEDEALNSDMSPSLLSGYLKRRLGYGEEETEGEVTVIFEQGRPEDGD